MGFVFIGNPPLQPIPQFQRAHTPHVIWRETNLGTHQQSAVLFDQIKPGSIGPQNRAGLFNSTIEDFSQVKGTIHQFGDVIEGTKISILLAYLGLSFHHGGQQLFEIFLSGLRDVGGNQG